MAYGKPLTEVPSFKFLGKKLLSFDGYWPAVEKNLRRARGKWGQLVKILGRGGLDRITVGRFYVALVQEVLLFEYNTWVLTPRLEKNLEVFHYRAVRQIAGMAPKHQQDGTWVYTPIEEALEMVGMEEIGVYIASHHRTVTQYIATHNIMNLCLEEKRNTGLCLSS